jgi:hypothetical protein
MRQNMSKRTDIDFSKHELKIEETEDVKIYDLKQQDTIVRRVVFINTCGVMSVTGDFGNWIFCREFYPSKGGYVSDDYWCEKLSYNQSGYVFDEDETRKEIKHFVEEELDNWNEIEKHDLNKYFEGCLYRLHDDLDYKHYAYRKYPTCFDMESVIYLEKIDSWLLAIFDAFEEICSRM